MIRKYKETDIDLVIDIWELSSKNAHPFLKDEFVEKVKNDMREIYLPNSETWVFEEDNTIIGFISMIGIEIGGLFVSPNNFSRGTGTKLVDFISEIHDTVEVEVFKKNRIGRAFYKKYGFRLIKEYIHEETNNVLLRLRYSKI